MKSQATEKYSGSKLFILSAVECCRRWHKTKEHPKRTGMYGMFFTKNQIKSLGRVTWMQLSEKEASLTGSRIEKGSHQREDR